MQSEVRDTTDALDALGNTTAATGKGFAIGSAVLTSLSLLAAFKTAAFPGVSGVVEITDAVVLSGALFGSMLPFLFAALTMLSVRKAAGAIIMEVRRQFADVNAEGKSKIMVGEKAADHNKCIEISTKSSVEEMILPGAYAILSPLAVGLLVGPRCLAGLLGGSIVSGCMLAIMVRLHTAHCFASRRTPCPHTVSECPPGCRCPTLAARGTTPRSTSRSSPRPRTTTRTSSRRAA
jgi:inorganic pyrophosphatase